MHNALRFLLPSVLALQLPLVVRADMSIVSSEGFTVAWDGNEGDHFALEDPAPVPANLANSPSAIPFASSDLGPELGIQYHVTANLNDSLYGNANSWIGGGSPSPAFAGISLGGLASLTGFAFGRDNGNGTTDVGVGGQLTDRSLGLYTIQITRVSAPDVDTPETEDATTGWQTIATIEYLANDDTEIGGAFTSYFRHEFEMAQGTEAIQATGFRIIVPATGLGGGTAIDEIELYGPAVVDPDKDGDGFDDTVEVELGFDPNDPTSTPESKTDLVTAVEFKFWAAKSKRYRIESSPDLVTWTMVEENILGRGTEITRLYSITGQPRLHYRAVRQQ